MIYCDAQPTQGFCEHHASFGIQNNGTEPITLWGPEEPDPDNPGRTRRSIIDQVWLPPMRNNTSFGRMPDGAGPSPVPVEPVEDLGDGSAVGVWAAASRRLGRYVRVGGSYSALRSRAGGSPVPFTPEHKGGAWVLAEKGYFGDDIFR